MTTLTKDTYAKPRWEYFGNNINATTIPEVLEQGGLDWTVSKRPILTSATEPTFKKKNDINPELLHPNGTQLTRELKTLIQKVLKNPNDCELRQRCKLILDSTRNEFIAPTNEFAIVRNDTNEFITTVGSLYAPLANEQCVEVLEPLMEDDDAVVERAGTFNKGASCWVIARLPQSLYVNDEVIDQFIRIGWSHDGSEKLTARFLYVATKSGVIISPNIQGTKVEISIRHTKSGSKKALEAKKIMKEQRKHADAFEGRADEMAQTECGDFREYMKALFPKCDVKNLDEHGYDRINRDTKTVNALEEAFEKNLRATGTLWGAFLTVSSYADNEKGIRIQGKSKDIDAKSENDIKNEIRAKSSMKSEGASMKLKQKAWTVLTAPLS